MTANRQACQLHWLKYSWAWIFLTGHYTRLQKEEMEGHLIGLLCVFILAAVSIQALRLYRGSVARTILNKRLSDVELLTRLRMTNQANTTNTENLLDCARKSGFSLNNPIPRNPASACYHLASEKEETNRG